MEKYRNPIIEINTIVYYQSANKEEIDNKSNSNSNRNSILLVKRGDEGKLSLPFKVLQYNVDPKEESKRIADAYFNDLEPCTTFFTVRGDPKRDPTGHVVAFVYSTPTPSAKLKEDQIDKKTAEMHSCDSIIKMNKEVFYNDHLDILNEFIKSKITE